MIDDDQRLIAMNGSRLREILFAVAWRGVVYSIIALIIMGCFVYIFAETAGEFFLIDALRLDRESEFALALFLSFPSFLAGWVMAVYHVLRRRFSDFRLVLLESEKAATRRIEKTAKAKAGKPQPAKAKSSKA